MNPRRSLSGTMSVVAVTSLPLSAGLRGSAMVGIVPDTIAAAKWVISPDASVRCLETSRARGGRRAHRAADGAIGRLSDRKGAAAIGQQVGDARLPDAAGTS